MFYLILLIMLVLFYLFSVPDHVKSTMNLVFLVFLSVVAVILSILLILGILRVPGEFWVSIAMLGIGFLAIRDLYRMPKKDKKYSLYRSTYNPEHKKEVSRHR